MRRVRIPVTDCIERYRLRVYEKEVRDILVIPDHEIEAESGSFGLPNGLQ